MNYESPLQTLFLFGGRFKEMREHRAEKNEGCEENGTINIQHNQQQQTANKVSKSEYEKRFFFFFSIDSERQKKKKRITSMTTQRQQ